ncbi:MAG: chaperone modulator CbpM [Kiritimatiellia bacterium]
MDNVDILTLHELAYVTGLRKRILERLVALEVIEPDEQSPEPCFRKDIVRHVFKIRRLHVELGVSWASMPLVLELLDRIEELERRVEH